MRTRLSETKIKQLFAASLSTSFSVFFQLSAEKYFGAKSLLHSHNSRRVFGTLEKVHHTVTFLCGELTGYLLVKNIFSFFFFFAVALEIFREFFYLLFSYYVILSSF